MKKLLLITTLTFIVVILTIIVFWCWVVANPELTVGFLTSIILLLAFTAALLNLRQMRHDRTALIANQIRETYDSKEMLEARALIFKIINKQEEQRITSTEEQSDGLRELLINYKKNNPVEYLKLISIPSLFDTVGWLVREHCCEGKAVDAQLDWETIFKLFESHIRSTQHKQKGESLDDSPTAMYGNFVWLVKELGK